MIAYLVLGIALAVGLVLILKWFTTADPKSVLRVLKWMGLVAVSVLALLLAATGRLAWTLGAITAVLPWIVPLVRARHAAKAYARMAGLGGGGRTSQVETRFLRMNLDHDSGQLDGEVVDGPYAGRRLSDLAVAELVALLAVCQSGDAQSAQVLESYLDRSHPDWREQAASAAGEEAHAAAAGGPMSREEAYEVLGLGPGASESEIKSAYHRLIAGLHPDKGGSNYLAAKINQAKQVLLGR